MNKGMFNTPPRTMVKTRGALARETLIHTADDKSEVLSRKVQSEIVVPKNELQEIVNQTVRKEGSLKLELAGPVSIHSKKSSTRSSFAARRKQLELEAAEAMAKIEKKLIEKRLEAELAALECGSSRKSQCSKHTLSEASNKVEEWLDKSHQDIQQQRAASPPPAPPAATSTVELQHLAHAMEQMATVTYSAHSKLLSRLATPKDLPVFFGDPYEWLQFKNIYEESNKLCNFSDSENISRLSRCLRGEAREAVSSLLICNTKPIVILEALKLRFGRPELIIHKIAIQLKKLQPLPQTYHTELVTFAVKIKNYVAAAESIKQTDYLRSPELLNSVVSKCPTTLINKWVDYLYEHQDDRKAKLELFADFLHCEATKVAFAGITYIHNQSDHRVQRKIDDRRAQVHSVLHSSELNSKCKVCRTATHQLTNCKKFQRALRKDRWQIVKKNRLCHICLLPGHSKEDCQAAPCDVDECGMSHHRLLHWPAKKTAASSDVIADDVVPASTTRETEYSNSACETVANTTIPLPNTSVLLKIVRVNIHGPSGIISTHALLDDGATVSLVSADLANHINLKGHPETIRIRGAWNSDIVCQSEVVSFKLSNSNSDVYELRARKISELDLPIQCLSKINVDAYEHLRNLKNYLCTSDVKPKLLIGQDNYQLLVSLKTVYRGKNEPCATLTPLGWCLHGIVPATVSSFPHLRSFHNEPASVMTLSRRPLATSLSLAAVAPLSTAGLIGSELEQKATHTCVSALTTEKKLQDNGNAHNDTIDNGDRKQLHELVRRSFAFETIGMNSKTRVNKGEFRAIDCIEKYAKLINGKWEVCLPWKNEFQMPNNFHNACKRFLGVQCKMKSDKCHAERKRRYAAGRATYQW